MVSDAQQHSQEDKRNREEIEVRNTADSTAYQLERQMEQLGDRVPPNEKTRAEQAISSVHQLVKDQSSDLAKLRQLTGDLQQIAHALSSAAYSEATASDGRAAGASASSSGGTRSGDTGDVVDAEFKETK
jgi:molecular chaperone DnaK